MPNPEQAPKLFTLEEANELIPKVGRVLKELRKGREQVHKLDQQIAVEELSWLQEDGAISPEADEAVGQLKTRIEEKARAFEEELEKLNKLGVQLKDLDEGSIDFFTDRVGELVYLCWKEGEDQILHWHDLESGFAGRRPIETL